MKSPENSPRSAVNPGEISVASEGTTDLAIALYELLEGRRAFLKIFSRRLGGEVLLVNPELHNAEPIRFVGPVYTTEELAFILSLSAEELRRFHYLKRRLVD